jgi:hypothetical protein
MWVGAPHTLRGIGSFKNEHASLARTFGQALIGRVSFLDCTREAMETRRLFNWESRFSARTTSRATLDARDLHLGARH